MSTENNCPNCGAPLDNINGNACPACGSALPSGSGSTPTIISSKSEFNNSAEAMDEIKRLVREGEDSAAEKVAADEFNLDAAQAKSTVEQISVDMPAVETAAPAQPAAEQKYEKAVRPDVVLPAGAAPKKSSSRGWIIGGVAAVLFLCLCCCMPTILFIAYLFSQNNP